jgi:hypothetical protein
LALLLAQTAGCVRSDSIQCGDVVCPAGTVCTPSGNSCADRDLVEACAGLGDGDSCSVPGMPIGVCMNGVCQTSLCGDGRVTGTEDCDGVKLAGRTCLSFGYYEAPGLACAADCTADLSACVGTCGDGVINGPEKCDGVELGGKSCLDVGYYAAPGLACAPDCKFATAACGGGHCGDGIVNGLEACDGGDLSGESCGSLGYAGAMSSLACSMTCTYHSASCLCSSGRCDPFTERCVCDKGGCGCAPI